MTTPPPLGKSLDRDFHRPDFLVFASRGLIYRYADLRWTNPGPRLNQQLWRVWT